MEYAIEKDGSIISNVALVELYIPYNKSYIEPHGDGYEILGLAKARIYGTEESIKNKKFIEKRFVYPTTFLTTPSDKETVTAPFPDDEQTDKYHCLKYYKGAALVNNNIIIEKVSAVESLFSSLTEGRLAYAGYFNLAEILSASKAMNGVSLRIPAYMEEVVLASCYRDKDDVNIQARHSKSGRIVGLTSRTNVSSKAYPGFSFQSPYEMLISSSITEEEGDTDLEKIIKGEWKTDEE